jgi:hypothetical protein
MLYFLNIIGWMGCASTSGQTDNVIAPSISTIGPKEDKPAFEELPEAKSSWQIEAVKVEQS